LLILGFAVILLINIVGPLLNASLRLQYRDVAKQLIHCGINVQTKDRYGATPLWYAVHRVDINMTTLLLNRGAKLDAQLAGLGLRRAVENQNINMLKLLLDRGVDPDTIYMGATPLAVACQQKDTAIISILLDKGADIHFINKYPNMPYSGKSPLDIARETGDRKLTELLLSHKNIP
jgi:ankyrin